MALRRGFQSAEGRFDGGRRDLSGEAQSSAESAVPPQKPRHADRDLSLPGYAVPDRRRTGADPRDPPGEGIEGGKMRDPFYPERPREKGEKEEEF